MNFVIRYKIGQGNAAIAGEITDTQNYWNFVLKQWDAVRSADTKVDLTERPDGDPNESWYRGAIPNVPPGGPYFQQIFVNATKASLGTDPIMGELTGIPDLTGCTTEEKNQLLAQYFAGHRSEAGSDTNGTETLYDSEGNPIGTAPWVDTGSAMVKQKLS